MKIKNTQIKNHYRVFIKVDNICIMIIVRKKTHQEEDLARFSGGAPLEEDACTIILAL